MRRVQFGLLAALASALLLTPGVAPAKGPKGNPEDVGAIQKNGAAFVEAFHKGDATALAAFWTEDGDFTDETGRHLKGRKAIEKAFKKLFKENKGLKVQIDAESLRFVTPDVAIEDGMTAVFAAEGGPPNRARYTIVHVKKDGKWLLSSVRDAPYTPPTNHRHLSGLEWAVGTWTGEGEDKHVERMLVTWTENQNFLIATFSTTFNDVSVGTATQWIGWDPTAKRIRSWIFDADGGFGDGSWSRDGKRWVLKTNSVLQDGKKAAATFVLTPVDADTITLQARDRTVDGNAQPDAREVTLKRVK
jgi:uncharacterized protein (TIGR02246 family)